MTGWTLTINLTAKTVVAKHVETETTAHLLLELDDALGFVITSAHFESKVGRLNNRVVRSLSFSAVEQDVMAASSPVNDTKSIEKLPPRKSEQFLDSVASQFRAVKLAGAARPVAEMARLNDTPLKTVQGWVTEARKAGLLPAGIPGKAG